MMKEQFLIVVQEPERAVAAIPMLLPAGRGRTQLPAGSDSTRWPIPTGHFRRKASDAWPAVETLFGEPKLKSLPVGAA